MAGGKGVYIDVKARSTIIDRNTGALVWENNETGRVPLRRSLNRYNGHQNAISDITRMAELISLTEDQMRLAIKDASYEAGLMMAEALRRAINKSFAGR